MVHIRSPVAVISASELCLREKCSHCSPIVVICASVVKASLEPIAPMTSMSASVLRVLVAPPV